MQMKFTFYHNNINVLDLDKAVEFTKSPGNFPSQERKPLKTEVSN